MLELMVEFGESMLRVKYGQESELAHGNNFPASSDKFQLALVEEFGQSIWEARSILGLDSMVIGK